MASNGTPPQPPQGAPSAAQQQQQQQQNAANHSAIIHALTTAFKNTPADQLQADRIATLLMQNMPQLTELAKQGKVNQHQLMQLKEFADKNKNNLGPLLSTNMQGQGNGAGPSKPVQAPQPSATPVPQAGPANAFKSSSPAPTLSSSTGNGYPISSQLTSANPGPVSFPSAVGRPTLSGGIAGGRISGTPAQIARSYDDASLLASTDNTQRKKHSLSDQGMRRSIQDLVFSIDPNVKIEPEVEDLLLDIADEFIDSVTNFGCRLAKHRGGDSLEVRDLQLHLERNHNIRIPGFASDETRISISQSTIAPTPGAGGGSSGKKSAQNTLGTLRSQRLAQVAQAKKEAKLM